MAADAGVFENRLDIVFEIDLRRKLMFLRFQGDILGPLGTFADPVFENLSFGFSEHVHVLGWWHYLIIICCQHGGGIE